MKYRSIHIVEVICKACACLLIALLLLIPLTESLHGHQQKCDHKHTDDVRLKDHHQNCSICDYLTNVHSEQLNFSGNPVFVRLNQSSPLAYIRYAPQHADGFILSCTNKGPPAIFCVV